MAIKMRKERSKQLNRVVSENIRGIMFGFGENVEQFCKAYGRQRSFFYLRSSGKIPWSLNDLQFVCERYNVPIERLVNGFTGQQIKSRY